MKVHSERIIAIDPTTGGFGFVVFEGEERLVDWGLQQVSGDMTAGCLRRLAELLRHHQPDVLVLEDCAAPGCRRRQRVRQLIARMAALATATKVQVQLVRREDVQRVFRQEGAGNKDEIAVKIVAWFPELAPRLPKLRKPWMSEDERMGIFDAAAMVVPADARSRRAD